MKVYVKTAGFGLSQQAKQNSKGWYEIETAENTLVCEVLVTLKIDKKDGITFMLNGNNVPDNTILKEGDEILLLRMMYGG